MNKLTIEQMDKIRKLHNLFMWKSIKLTFAYLLGLFLGNVIIAIISLSWIKNPSFTTLATFGAAIIVLTGLRSEVERAYSCMKSDVDKISKGTNQ